MTIRHERIKLNLSERAACTKTKVDCHLMLNAKGVIEELQAQTKPREVMWESMDGMLIYTHEVGANSRNIEMDEGPWKRLGFTDEE